jgi:hypothetical protein
MTDVPTDRLRPGMTLSTDVFNHDGQLLLPAGYRLQERHILMLKSWGITEAGVASDGESELEEEGPSPESLHEAEEALRPHFFHQDFDSPVVLELFKICARRKAAGRAS